MKGDPRLRGDDEERARMTPGQARGRLGGGVGMTMEERGGVSVAGILHKGIGRSTLCGYAGFVRLAIVGLLVLRFRI